MTLPRRVIIFSVAGAPYRDAFYDLLAERLGSEVAYLRVLGQAPDHAWSESGPGQGSALKQEFLPAVVLKGRGLFRRWRQGRNPLVLPTPATLLSISRLDPDLILIQEYSPVAMAISLWARWKGRKVITMSEIGRGTRNLGFPTKLRHWLGGQLVDGQLAHTMAACRPIARSIVEVCFSPHAVKVGDEADAQRAEHQPVRVLFVGNLIERKGIDLLLNAAMELKRQGRAGKFVIRLVGGGNEEWLKPQLDQLNGDVEMVGFKQGAALEEEYRSADIFVLPSRFDTFGVVAHEAASHGLPLVLSRRAGCSELFGEHAALFDPENSAQLVASLGSLIDDPALRQERGRAALAAARQWSAPANAERVADWLSKLRI